MGISNSDERVRKVRKFVLSAQADLQDLIIADMKTMKTVPLGRDSPLFASARVISEAFRFASLLSESSPFWAL